MRRLLNAGLECCLGAHLFHYLALTEDEEGTAWLPGVKHSPERFMRSHEKNDHQEIKNNI